MSQVPFQLLELTIVSAQDLSPASKHLRTYAVIWVNPERKLRTRIDQHGQINPTWNDKFVFRVDDGFLDSDKSFAMIEIYALGWLRDNLIGSIRVMINNLIPPAVRKENAGSRRFVALQIRRPSGRPQGILNMGVTLLDNTMRSMPLRTELSASAVGFQDVMDLKMYKNNKVNIANNDEKMAQSDEKKVQLWRSLSDLTDITSKMGKGNQKNNAPVRRGGGSLADQGSMVSGGGSVVNGGGSVVNGGSMLNGSICNSDVGPSPSVVAAAVARGFYPTQLGPPPPPGSSVLEDWTVAESGTEGLKTKIERWRMEIPPIYDHRTYQKLQSTPGTDKKLRRRRRNTADDIDDSGGGGGSGLFSCFGNLYCCEFTVTCGGKSGGGKARVRAYSDSKLSISELDS